MPETRKYQHLHAWINRYGNGAVHWTVFTDLDFTQRAARALTDLHKLLRDGTDEDILAFFRKARTKMPSETTRKVDDHESTFPAPWATPTD
jgi:hypothetical protein